MSTINPIWVRMLLSKPRAMTPSRADSTLMGTIRMMASGSDQLSYWAASARNANSTERMKMKIAVSPVERSWKASSVHSKLMPWGMIWAASFSMMSSASPEETPGAALPCSGTDVNML